MFYLFVKNSCEKHVLDDLKEDHHYWITFGCGDRSTLMIATCNENEHGTRVSAVVTKADLLSMRAKDFKHSIQDAEKTLTKER